VKCYFFIDFEDIDHSILDGNVTVLYFEIDCMLMNGTANLKYYFKADHKIMYKEIVDMNFQNLTPMLASVYRNQVLLKEIFTKK
jgi:hypothetical protein